MKSNGEDKNIDEKLKMCRTEINIYPRAIWYAVLKEIHSHYDEQAHPQLIKCKKEAYVRY